ncbi:hypothetical protein ALP03_05868 [Pseudomonas amygdali pv. tabaci]|uniref:Uncharacterized protein n=1 Tax=Pseudomonas amygdali pv. tabaci TaxID=322 RepID=A0A3M6HF78_PSEAJ|nr:hypothetical protein ALP03_05868 [Pseudomonas amygdali pv. tabaci]
MRCIDPPFRACTQKVVGFELQNTQHTGQLLQARRQTRRCGDTGFTQAVDLTDHFEQYRTRFRRAEIIIHRRAETLDERLPTRRLGNRQPLERVIEAFQRRLRLTQAVFGVVDRAAVVAGYQQVTHHFRMVFLQHVADGEEVVQGLGHLLAIDANHPAVQPGIGVGLAGGRFALGNFVFMVRKLQIAAATMNIEGVTQAAGRHHRAFDMPARTPCAPWRLPARLARLDAFPEHEVQWVFLGLIHFDPRADAQVFYLLARQLAVALKLAHTVIHVAVTRSVGIALVDQGLDHRVHASDVIGGTRLHVRLEDIEARLVLVHGVDHARSQRVERLTVVTRTIDDLVVNIGDVAHISQLVTAEAQPASHQIERHHAAAMAQMAVVVHGHPADVHAHLVAIQRFEYFFALGERVVNRKHYLPLGHISGPGIPQRDRAVEDWLTGFRVLDVRAEITFAFELETVFRLRVSQ